MTNDEKIEQTKKDFCKSISPKFITYQNRKYKRGALFINPNTGTCHFAYCRRKKTDNTQVLLFVILRLEYDDLYIVGFGIHSDNKHKLIYQKKGVHYKDLKYIQDIIDKIHE